MTIYKSWLEDLPQQFNNKPKIQAFVNAISNQLAELDTVYEELNTKLTLDTATGYNLNAIGNIMNMTRKDASKILLKAKDDVITDEEYRSVLKYQSQKLGSECTYADIMQSIDAIWDAEQVKYIEDNSKPASIVLDLSRVSTDGVDPALSRILAIKPAGVSVSYNIAYASDVQTEEVFAFQDLSYGFKAIFNETKLLDGSWILDGSNVLCGDQAIEVRINEEEV